MSDVVWVETQDDLLEVLNNNRRVVVDFTAPSWCAPCQKFAPHYERAAGTVKDVKFVAVDVDKADWAMVEYGVRSVPTVKLFENVTFVRDIKAPQGALPFINDLKE